jgi:hypothetical protein
VNKSALLLRIRKKNLVMRDEQLVSKYRREIFVPGLGLLIEQ